MTNEAERLALAERLSQTSNAKIYFRCTKCESAPAGDQLNTPAQAAQFVQWALREGSWQGCDLDGGGIQDKAESLGLIVSVTYDPEKHGNNNDHDCEPGDPWFVFSPELVALAGKRS